MILNRADNRLIGAIKSTAWRLRSRAVFGTVMFHRLQRRWWWLGLWRLRICLSAKRAHGKEKSAKNYQRNNHSLCMVFLRRGFYHQCSLASSRVGRQNGAMNLIIRCPQCPNIQQGTSVPIDRLKELLNSGEPVTVIGLQCGHTWALSDAEVESIRKLLAA